MAFKRRPAVAQHPTAGDTLSDVAKRCAYCGQWFEPKRSDAKYGSTKCRVAAHREAQGLGQVRNKKKRVVCQQCGKKFWTARPDQAKFCSSKCRSLWHYQHRDK